MAQILDSVAARLGSAVGSGLGSGISALADAKMRQLQGAYQQELMDAQRKKQMEQLVPGLAALFPDQSKEQLQSLGGLPPELLSLYTKQQLQAPQQQAFAQALNQILGGHPAPGTEGSSQGVIPTQGLTSQQALQLAQLGLQKQGAAEKLALQKEALELKKQAAGQKEEKSALEINKPLIQELQSKLSEVPKRSAEFSRMQKLIDSGKVDFGPLSSIRLMTGTASPETQELQKFIKNSIGNYVKKGVLTDQKAKILEESMINLSQTQEGAQKVLYELKQFNELDNADAEAYKEVLKENKNKIPKDFAVQVEEKAAKKKAEIYKNIEQGFQTIPSQGKSVSSIPSEQRQYGMSATNKKTGEKFFWNGTNWVNSKEWKG